MNIAISNRKHSQLLVSFRPVTRSPKEWARQSSSPSWLRPTCLVLGDVLGKMKGVNSERMGEVGIQQGIADHAVAALRRRKGEEEVIQDNS